MSIQKIVAQALQEKYLTPAMEAEVGRICENAEELTLEEYKSLDRLMEALLNGEVVAMPQKQFTNLMEEMVINEVVTQLAHHQVMPHDGLEITDVAAYALNRLPPLYATTEEGATYQRSRASEELELLIQQQVNEGIRRYLNRPTLENRQPLDKPMQKDLLSRVSRLLETFAPD